MDSENFQKYLKERYEPEVNWYDKKSILNQRRYRYLQSVIIILSAITPVLVAIKEIDFFKNYIILTVIVIVISAIVAIGTTMLKTFKYQENWINYRTTCETLKKEIYFYTSTIGDYKDTDDRESLFVERVESLISRENTMWLTTQRPKTEKGNK